jgi:peroxiredoxin
MERGGILAGTMEEGIGLDHKSGFQIQTSHRRDVFTIDNKGRIAKMKRAINPFLSQESVSKEVAAFTKEVSPVYIRG